MVTQRSKLKWLLFLHFLLCDTIHARAPPPPGLKNSPRPAIPTASSSPFSSPLPQMAIDQDTEQEKEGNPVAEDNEEEELRVDSAFRLVSTIKSSLQGQVHLHENVSCAELAAGPWSGESFSRELLGLVMVPVLVTAGCPTEAQSLIMNLYKTLGPDDTQEFLEDVVALMKQGKNTPLQTSPPRLSGYSQNQLQAVMFNIQQLAEAGENISVIPSEASPGQTKQCQGWLKVKSAQLLGQTADQGQHLHLREAKQICQSLGFNCAGLTKDGDFNPKLYRVILRPGSRVVPLVSTKQSESWIQRCGLGPVRWRRHAALQQSCTNEKEERVYNVVEWIPGVSTLYNLGTAVYYASVNCSDTAKERAIHTAVDLGTDALMAVTGGTAGVAGYALGAGLKTGVKAGLKYLLNNMSQEGDLLMNQDSFEDGMIIIQ